MPRPLTLFTGPWADLPCEEVAQKAKDFGYRGLELACWGDHFLVDQALADPNYIAGRRDLLDRYDLECHALSAHRVGQAVCDPIGRRHQAILPDYIWGDGDPAEISWRAAEEMKQTAHAAQRLGVSVVNGFSGSAIWHLLMAFPAATEETIEAGFKQFADRWNPILDVFGECGVRFALEVHPAQIAYDFYTAERALAAVDHRPELGFNFDPSHLHWMGVDPVEFLRAFPDRIFHVHIKDAALTLNGRSSILCSHLPAGDQRRGWQYRAPGHGGINWEECLRTLNEIGYDGPLSVEWSDRGIDRDYGAREAAQFVARLDFPTP